MRRAVSLLFILVCASLVLTGCAGNRPDTVTGVVKGDIITLKATVVAIDLKNRIVTLKDSDGDVQDFAVGKEAVNLPQVKPGDIVTVKFVEAVAVEVIKPGSAAAAGQQTTIARAKPGEMPGGVMTRTVSTTAAVKAVDKKAGTISVVGPSGKTVKVKVLDPSNLDLVKAGDELLITYTDAIAISVERPE